MLVRAMHEVAGAHLRPSADPESPRAFVNTAGACVGALGAIDLLIGLAMFAAAASADATIEGAPAAQAMRSYGLRVALAGAVSLAFVWTVFAEPGARAIWFLLPLGIAIFDLAFDVAALSGGQMPTRVIFATAAVHEVLASAVAAVAIAGWRKERAIRPARAPR